MSGQSHSLTLTRWHKVAERILKEMTRLDSSIQSKLSQAAFSSAARQTAQKDTVTKIEGDVESMMEQFETLNKDLELIRVALGEANTSEGVAAQLAQVDRINRSMKLRTAILTIECNKMLTFEDYMGMEPSATDPAARPRANADVIKVKVLSDSRIVAIEQEVEASRRKIHAVSDETNDKNRAKLSLQISTLSAKAAGLDGE